MSKLIINIKQLIQVRDNDISFVKAERMNELPSISDAFLFIKNGEIWNINIELIISILFEKLKLSPISSLPEVPGVLASKKFISKTKRK